MRKPYRVVNLIKNQLYPTYQLHAYLSNKKTTPQDGLRLGALLTLDWLCRRLGADVPEELAHVPDPSAYRSVQDDCLVSFHQKQRLCDRHRFFAGGGDLDASNHRTGSRL